MGTIKTKAILSIFKQRKKVYLVCSIKWNKITFNLKCWTIKFQKDKNLSLIKGIIFQTRICPIISHQPIKTHHFNNKLQNLHFHQSHQRKKPNNNSVSSLRKCTKHKKSAWKNFSNKRFKDNKGKGGNSIKDMKKKDKNKNKKKQSNYRNFIKHLKVRRFSKNKE